MMQKLELTLLAIAASLSVALGYIYVETSSNRLIDTETGREVFYHGVNAVQKSFPWYPEDEGRTCTSFSEEDMIMLQDLGLNIVRYGVMWAGVEPVKGLYNNTYLQKIRSVFDKASNYGITVLADFHQDVWAEDLCGEGVPRWAFYPRNDSQPFPWPVHAPYPIDNTTGLPVGCGDIDWFTYYFTEATSSAVQALYDNREGLRDSWLAYWATVARTLVDVPSVIGYDLFNEPWAGDIYRDPLLLIPGVADKQNLQPLYDAAYAAISAVDPNRLLIFESVTWDDLPVGFTAPPGGDHNRSVLGYHYYKPPNLDLESTMKLRQSDVQKLGIGGMLTEFWIEPYADPEGLPNIINTMDAADRYLQSWIGWDKPGLMLNCSSEINPTMAKTVARTYAPAVAGRVQSMLFNSTTSDFTLRYVTAPGVTLPVTEIYLHEEYYYPQGYQVTIDPPLFASWSSPSRRRIEVKHDPLLPWDSEITVTITRV